MPKEKPKVNIGEVIKSYRATAAYPRATSSAVRACCAATFPA